MNPPTEQLSDADRQLEATLRGLGPVAPSHNPFPTQHAPGIIPFPERRRSSAPLVVTAAAAAIAVVASLQTLLPPSPATSTSLPAEKSNEVSFDVEPIQQIGYIVDARPAPIIDVPGGTPLRPLRLRTVNTTLYRDHATGSTITIGEPSDRVILVPVSFH